MTVPGIGIRYNSTTAWEGSVDTIEGSPARAISDAFIITPGSFRNGFWIENDIATWFLDEAGTVRFTAADDGDLVRCIKYRSFNRYICPQTADAAPTGRWDNALQRWYFDLSSGRYIDVPCAHGVSPHTMLFGLRVGSNAGKRYLMRGLEASTAFGLAGAVLEDAPGTTGYLGILNNSPSGIVTPDAYATDEERIVSMSYDPATGDGSIRVDGVNKVTGNAALAGSATGGAGVRIGQNYTIGAQGMNGRIYSVGLVLGAITDPSALEAVAALNQNKVL